MHTSDLTLKTLLIEMFELWAMMFDDGVAPDAPESTSWMHVKVDYCGPVSGTLELFLPFEISDALVMNILGLSHRMEIEDGMREDALREMGNLICGHFVTRQYGVDAVFKLSPPFIEVCQKLDADMRDAASLSVEGNAVYARAIEKNVAAAGMAM